MLHGKLVFPIKWHHKGAQKWSSLVEKFWAPSWHHLMGKTCFPWSACICQNPRIANLLFQYRWVSHIVILPLMKVSEFYLTLAWTGSSTDEGRWRLVQRGSITVQLTSYLFCVDSAALPMLNEKQLYFLVKFKPVKQEVSRTVLLTHMVSVSGSWRHMW